MGHSRIIGLQLGAESDWPQMGEQLGELAAALSPGAGLESLQLVRVDDRTAVLIVSASSDAASSELGGALVEPWLSGLQLVAAPTTTQGETIVARGGVDAFARVDVLDDVERCAYFVRHVVAAGQAWGLYDETWARSPAAGDTEALPLWPQRELAARCVSGRWRACVPRPIGLTALREQWLTGMDEDGIVAVLMPGPMHGGTVVTAAVLSRALRTAMDDG